MDLMNTNAKGKNVRDKELLLYGTCVEEHEGTLEKFENYSKLSFCPEKEHINMAFYKLMAMMSVAKSLTVVTVDGSPHCVQLHYIADEVRRYSKKNFDVVHYIIRDGKIVEISSEAVKTSRYLYKVEKLLAAKSSEEKNE